MPQTFRLSFDISAEADPSDLLDRLIEFQQQLVDELEEGEDFFGEPVPNHASSNTCSVEHDPMEKQDMQVRVSVWRRQLATALGAHCNCTVAYASIKGIGQFISMYGHRTDIELLKYLYDICERQIEGEARHYVNSLKGYWRGGKKVLGNNFQAGGHPQGHPSREC